MRVIKGTKVSILKLTIYEHEGIMKAINILDLITFGVNVIFAMIVFSYDNSGYQRGNSDGSGCSLVSRAVSGRGFPPRTPSR
jgi:hypothetical protein